MATPGHRQTTSLSPREVRAATRSLAALLGALVSWPTPAGARPPASSGGPAESVTLRWDAPAPECPGEAVLRARVRSLLGPAPLQLDASARVQRLPPGAAHRWRLDIALRWSARSDARTLFASDCQSLADATVVLVAVLAAPLSAGQKLAPRRNPPAAPAADAGASTAPAPDSDLAASAAPTADANLPDASTSPDPDLAGASIVPAAPAVPDEADLAGEPQATASADDPVTAPQRPPEPVVVDPGPLAPPAPRKLWPPRPRGPFVRVAGALGYGALPRGDFGVSVAAGGLLPRVRLEAAATFLALQPASLGDASGRGGMFGLTAVAARACPRFLGPPVELSVCGALEFGLLGARSVGLTPQRRQHGPWLALSLGGALDWWFSSQVALHLDVEGSAAPLITAYRIHDDALFSPRRLGVRAGLGLTVALAPSPTPPRRSRP